VVEPVVVMITVTVFVPYECTAGCRVSVPLVDTTGSAKNAALVALLVHVTALKVHVWPD
jgi:hypothetical protein